MTNYLHRFTHETNLEDHKIPWILWTFKATWVNAPTDKYKETKNSANDNHILYGWQNLCNLFCHFFVSSRKMTKA